METSKPQESQEEQLQAIEIEKKKSYLSLWVGLGCLVLIVCAGVMTTLLSKKEADDTIQVQVVEGVTVTPISQTSPTQAPMEKQEFVDERPLGSLPYSFISGVGEQSLWVERGIPTSNLTLRTFESLDKCLLLDINDAGPLNKTLELYLSERYQLPIPINAESYYKTQYLIPGYKSITIGPMGAGEISHTAIQVNGRMLLLNVSLGNNGQSPNCLNPKTDQAKNLIESIRF